MPDEDEKGRNLGDFSAGEPAPGLGCRCRQLPSAGLHKTVDPALFGADTTQQLRVWTQADSPDSIIRQRGASP